MKWEDLTQPQRDHFLWRQRARATLPELSARIFALRPHGAGLNFAWSQQSFERLLGELIMDLHMGHEQTLNMIESDRDGERRIARTLHEDLVKAEQMIAKRRYEAGSLF